MYSIFADSKSLVLIERMIPAQRVSGLFKFPFASNPFEKGVGPEAES